MTSKPYYYHEDFAFVNGFPSFTRGLDVVTLGTCPTSNNISFKRGGGRWWDKYLGFETRVAPSRGLRAFATLDSHLLGIVGRGSSFNYTLALALQLRKITKYLSQDSRKSARQSLLCRSGGLVAGSHDCTIDFQSLSTKVSWISSMRLWTAARRDKYLPCC